MMHVVLSYPPGQSPCGGLSIRGYKNHAMCEVGLTINARLETTHKGHRHYICNMLI